VNFLQKWELVVVLVLQLQQWTSLEYHAEDQ